MIRRFIFWMRTNFGFSRKESQGFLLVVPLLLAFYSLPKLIQSFTDTSNVQFVSENQLDSLLAAGWTPAISDVTFNRQDTVTKKNPAILEGIQMIPFSEADSIVLQIVPGVGPTLAGRIIKYHERLGGFHSKSQLYEVYGVSTEVGDQVWAYFEFSPTSLKKVAINQESIQELANHPYIRYGQAKVIIAFRDQHGPYSSPEDLKKIRIFTSDWIEQVSPYLEFSN